MKPAVRTAAVSAKISAGSNVPETHSVNCNSSSKPDNSKEMPAEQNNPRRVHPSSRITLLSKENAQQKSHR